MEPVKSYSDHELMVALRASQIPDAAIKFLYRAHYGGLSLFVRQHDGSNQDAEDIFQEVLIGFIDAVRTGKFRQESSVKTFLYAMTRNLWYNEMKKRNRTVVREMKYEENKVDADPDISEYIAARESRSQVLQIVDRLDEACKKILLAFYYENLPMREIVSKVNYENEQVVRNKKYKCLKKLAELLNEDPQLAENLKTVLHYDG